MLSPSRYDDGNTATAPGRPPSPDSVDDERLTAVSTLVPVEVTDRNEEDVLRRDCRPLLVLLCFLVLLLLLVVVLPTEEGPPLPLPLPPLPLPSEAEAEAAEDE